jgi:threonine dehydrogenase-like Zn-dependent dehydrogenase
VVLGHEVCGRVVEVGPGTDGTTTPRVGDLVTVEPHREALDAQRRGDVDKVFVAPAGEAAALGG